MIIDQKNDILAWLLLAKRLAKQAGRLVIGMRHPIQPSNSFMVDQKTSSVDLVTSADIASQSLVFDALRAACPSHRLIGEEGNANSEPLDDRPTWIVDAIDGTTNFVHDMHEYSVSIGLVVNKQVIVGAVYNPATNDMFAAARGYGATLNDERISVIPCSSVKSAVVISEWSYERSSKGIRTMLGANQRLLERGVRGIRQLGSGSLDMCYVAMGRAQAVYGGIAGADAWKIWDYAAGVVIAEEAGADIRTANGEPFYLGSGSVVCATPGVMDELVGVINGQ